MVDNLILYQDMVDEQNSISWMVQLLRITDKNYISLARHKKWIQDQKFHIDTSRMVCIRIETFEDIICSFNKAKDELNLKESGNIEGKKISKSEPGSLSEVESEPETPWKG